MGNILSANLAYMQLITRYTLHLFILVSLNFSKLHEKKKHVLLISTDSCKVVRIHIKLCKKVELRWH